MTRRAVLAGLPVLCLPVLCLLLLPAEGLAQAAPSLHFPLDCAIGKTCWIVDYVDDDPGPGVRDYKCGPRSYEGHDGVDFGLADMAAMQTGVAVRAAAAGTVLNVRDGMQDGAPSDKDITDMLRAGRGCGNGVMVDLGDDWKTLYCHMQNGSVAVKPGQAVKAGDILGKVGQSGAAQFPHLHLSVLHAGKIVDPFTGKEQGAGCGGEGRASLWNADTILPYEPAILYAAGFHAGLPDMDALKIDTGSPRAVDAHAGALTFWAAFFGVRAGDRISMTITGPDGHAFATREIVQEGDKARQFYYIGRPSHAGLLPGPYKGVAAWSRPGQETRSMERSVSVR